MKNIVLCSDGTGNSGGKTRGTNVWRIYNAVNRHRQDLRQVTYYDDGVGTEGLRWVKLFTGAFGWGLSRNIRQLYGFLASQYEPGDRIFLFGFSRGAFTVRAFAGMVQASGLLKREAFLAVPESRRTRLLRRLLWHYRTVAKCRPKNLDEILMREFPQLSPHAPIFRKDTKIAFVGVFDTVDAVGMPIDNLNDWFNDCFKALTGKQLYGFHDRKLGPAVQAAAQALALDDERKTFHPNVWNADGRVTQVWFPGAHSNVGGGYPKDALSHVAMDWMMEQAEGVAELFHPGARGEVQRVADAHGRLYDSRRGAFVYYRVAARDLPCLHDGDPQIAIHSSVFERIAGDPDYAPAVVPADCVPTPTGSGPFASLPEPLPRQQEAHRPLLQRLLRWQVISYFVFLGFNLLVLGAVGFDALCGSGLPPVWIEPWVPRLKWLLPGPTEFVAEVVGRHPKTAFGAALFGIALFNLSRRLKRRIQALARLSWNAAGDHEAPAR